MRETSDLVRKEKNELIIKRRRKKFVKKCILLLTLLISVLTAICFKHPYFNIKKIQITNNKNIPKEEIMKLSGIFKGDNIFYIDMDRIKKGILTNPYILNLEVKKKLPDTIIINIEERDAIFYGEKGGNFVVIDKNGVVLENRKDIKNMNLIKLQGFDQSKSEVGKPIISEDDRKLHLISNIGSLLGKSKDNYKISLVDIQNISDIKVYYGNFLIKLGNDEDLDKKLNKAFSILLQKEELKSAKKGYIDVSFDGNPVVFLEK